MRQRRATLLVADIGGTKTDIAIFAMESNLHAPQAIETFLNKDFERPEAVFDRFFERHPGRYEMCCIAVAGPVTSGVARLTNLAWTVCLSELERRYGFENCLLVNDVHAIGSLVPTLRPSDLLILKEGAQAPHGSKAVISPGTGLGQSFLTWAGEAYRTHPSEGGHVAFAPVDALQIELLESIREGISYVAVEDICSGMGLPRIHQFLTRRAFPLEAADTCVEKCVSPSTAEIVTCSLEASGCAVCRDTVRLFSEILVAETRNTALKLMASGGVYIAGSFALRLADPIREAFGASAFTEHDTTGLLRAIPVYLITDPHPVLRGTYWYVRSNERWSTQEALGSDRS